MSRRKPVLEAIGLSRTFTRGKAEIITAVNNVDFQLNESELVILMGPSGSGKSTLLNLLGGLDAPTDGSIIYRNPEDDSEVDIVKLDENKLTDYRRNRVGFVFQNWMLIDNLTAVENVEVPLYPSGISSRIIRSKAIALLRQMGLDDREDHFPKELSGGEQQRVALARAIITNPTFVFADEPTGNLDQDTGERIMRLLKRVCRSGTSIVVATHDIGLRRYADRFVKILDGQFQH
ncbi:MAG: ABC transporter ATP-binding protein [Candidatus Heimdallarchaeota archaeon]|nr:ABC transporter ATP-binding protein [Candidatus Heimdallarchaeota archaeon]MCK5048074.1 ABC transporter ATP-binding protein [Candidatus Heimdallarchaeota archaeon]